jgi:hypothetical protein
MKKILVVFMSLMLCLFAFAPVAFSDTEDDATAEMNVTVDPNITVGDNPAGVHMSVQTGDVLGAFVFQVDANMQYVDIQVGASHLYKADDPNSEVAPIIVNETEGVFVNPNSGEGATLAFNSSSGYDINGFPAIQTSAETFESSQNGHFSQDVDVTVTWNQDDPEKPQGDYSGFVQFYCMMIP